MKKIIIFNTVLIISIALTGCSVKKPVFTKVTNFNVNYMAADSVNISLEALYYNPSSFKAKLSRIEVDASVNAISVYKLKQELNVKVKSTDFFSVPFTITFNPKTSGPKAMAVFTNIIFDKKLALNFNGRVLGQVFFSNFNVPFDYSTKLELDQLNFHKKPIED